jgi:hypothetical protein
LKKVAGKTRHEKNTPATIRIAGSRTLSFRNGNNNRFLRNEL